MPLEMAARFFFQAEDGIRDLTVTGVQTCALPIYHHDHQNDGKAERSFDVTDRGADSGGAIQNDGGVNALRNRCFDGRKFCANAIDGLNNIGARLAENDQQDGAFAVQIASGANILYRVDDVSDIREMDS